MSHRGRLRRIVLSASSRSRSRGRLLRTPPAPPRADGTAPMLFAAAAMSTSKTVPTTDAHFAALTGVSTCYPNCATVADERLGRVRCRLAVSSSARGFPFLSLSLRACGVVVWSECAGGFVLKSPSTKKKTRMGHNSHAAQNLARLHAAHRLTVHSQSSVSRIAAFGQLSQCTAKRVGARPTRPPQTHINHSTRTAARAQRIRGDPSPSTSTGIGL